MKYSWPRGELVEILSEREVMAIAWDEVLEGAQSYMDDWIDEEGDFTEEDLQRVIDAAQRIIDYLTLVRRELDV